MFSRRSGRRRRQSRLGLFGPSIRSRWSQSNVERVFGLKHGYSRRLAIETLEDRRLLTVNVYFDNVNNQISIVDDYADDILQTGGEGSFSGANNVQEDNDVTLSNGVATPGRLRITDPLGVILEPGVSGTQISDTVVEVDSTAIVRVDLQGGNDRLIFASDFNAVATLVTLNAHGGDPSEGDGLIMNATAAAAETVTVTVDNSDQDEQDITGYAGKTLNVRGYESILYDGSGGDDNLIVDLGQGEATARVQNSSPADTDEVVSSTLPTVLFNGINNFTLTGDSGESTNATFVIDSLGGATTYTFASQDADSLAIEGNGGADITASMNGANVRVVGSGNTIETTGMNAFDLLQVLTLGGNDTFLVNIGGTAPIATPFEYDGGAGTDILLVQGAPVPAIVDVVYTPRLQPDEGRLEYRGAAGARLMSIDFDDLEPVVDLVVAPTLIINGTPASNAITDTVGANSGVVSAANPAGVVTGQVTIDNSESIEFANKTAVTINGLNGDDVIVADNGTVPATLATITFNGNIGNDNIRIENLPAAGGTFASATVNGADGNDVIDASQNPNATPLTLSGGAGNDTITGGLGTDTISGGANNDVIIASPGNDTVDGVSGDDQLNIIGRILPDTMAVNQSTANTLVVTFNGNARTYTVSNLDLVFIDGGLGDDVVAINVVDTVAPASSLPFDVVGNSPNASDRLIVNDDGTGDLVIHRQGPDGRSGSIIIGSTTRVGTVNSTIEPPKVRVHYESTERVDITPIDAMGRTGTGFGGQLIVFHYDDFESNDAELNATPIGPTPIFIGLRNIDPGPISTLPPPFPVVPGDSDWYEFRPDKIGTFRFEVLFEQIDTVPDGRAGLPDDGNLKIEVYRANGTLIGSSDQSVNTAINIKTSEFFDFSAAADTSYYLRVLSSNDAGQGTSGNAINNYELNVSEVDTEGPQVFDPNGPTVAIFPNNLTTFDLFAQKPNVAGPTPLIYSLTINIRDLPVRAPGDLYAALLEAADEAPGLFRVVGDHVGIVAIQSVDVINEPTSNFEFNATVTTPGSTTTFAAAGLIPLANTPQEPRPGDTVQFNGEIRTITAYNPATGQITVGVPFLSAPVIGSIITIRSFAEAKIVLTFVEPLPDDRFTLTLSDEIVDPALNQLDGESNAAEPRTPTFPSGNGIAGGDFVARFTVDSRPEIGSSVAADIDLDINGNFVWDPANDQIGNDATNVDLSFNLLVQGASGFLAPGGFNVNDVLFAGKFTNGGVLPPRLFDQLGAFGYASDLPTPSYRFLIDTNGDGVVSQVAGSTDRLITLAGGASPVVLGVNVAGAIPIAGNFNNNTADGDEIGLYSAGKWLLDTNHDFLLDTLLTGNLTGAPIVGDFDGNGTDDFGVFNNNIFSIGFNLGPNASATMTWGYPGVLDKPIAADMDQDGIDDIGLWEPRNSASVPREVSEWYFLVSGTPTAPLTSVTSTTQFAASALIGATINPGDFVRIRSGVDANQVRTVQAFNSLTGQITLTTPLTSLPALGDTIAVGGTLNSISKLNHAFDISPFGNDIAAEFGDELALPIVGNFDPPVSPTVVAPSSLSGDYDGSGYIDNADKAVWRATFGSTTNLLADGSHNGQVDAADYVMWRKSAGASGSGSSLTTSQVGVALEVESSSTVRGASAAAGVREFGAASGRSSTFEADETSFGITATIETVSVAARKEAPTANLTALDRAFGNMVTGSPKTAICTLTFPNPSTFEDNLLLLGVTEYVPPQMTLPLVDLIEDGVASSDAIDSVLTDFAADSVLELTI